MVRWILKIDSDFNVPVKVEIEDSEYSGSAIPVKGGDSAIVRTAGQPNSDPNKKVFDSRLELSLAGARGDYDDLFTRNLSRFRVKLYIDGDFDSVYIPIPDTFKVPDVQNNDFGNFAISIQCASFRSFNQRDVWDVLEVDADDIPIKSRLQTIHAIINDLFDLPIIDGSVFSPANGLGASPLLKQWVDYTRLQGLNSFEALELLIPKGHQYRMSKGAVIIVPVTESQFSGFRYSGPSLGFPSSETFNDNFTAIRLGRVLETSKNKLPKYDGVRRIYDPLESANAVPSGSLNAEDFGIEDPSDAQTVEFPIGWERVNYPGGFDTRLVSTSVGGSRFAWEIPETAPPLPGIGGAAIWQVESKEVLAGQRLLIRFTVDYDSRNQTAVFPLRIQVGNKVLRNDFDIAGQNEWIDVQGVFDFETFDVGVSSRTGYTDYEFLSPPIPRTGQLKLSIATPEPLGASWEFSEDHVLRISEISIDPADEEGEVLRRSETLAGSKGDVYEYTEGFGDGFSSFTPGALRNADGSSGFTDGGLVLTELWRYTGEPDQLPLAELETKYLYSQLSRDLDRISGTADVFDFIALIEGKRVNYISTDFRYGNSEIELIEIEEHDLEAATEDRREKGGGSYGGGGGSPEDDRPFIDRLQSIGELRETIENEERTSVRAEFDLVARKGIEYWIVNEAELSRTDRQEGIYPINPVTTDSGGDPLFPGDAGYEDGTKEYGPGLLEALPIQSSLINAPEGSLIYKAPGQTETEQNVGEEKDEEFDERIETVNFELDQLELDLIDLDNSLTELNTVTLPALNDDLDQLETDLNTLNTVTIPNLQSELDDVLPITETKISDDAISTPKLQTNAIVAGKIAAGAITAIKIDTDAVTANKIQAGAIIAGKIGADAIVANNIQSDAITTNKIQAGAITTNKIGADQVTANKIDVDDLGANNAFIDRLMAQTLTITSNGRITNTAGEYRIDSNAFSTTLATSSTLEPARAYKVFLNDDYNALRGAFWGEGGIINVESVGGFRLRLRSASRITIDPSTGGLDILNLPTSSPSESNRLWRDTSGAGDDILRISS